MNITMNSDLAFDLPSFGSSREAVRGEVVEVDARSNLLWIVSGLAALAAIMLSGVSVLVASSSPSSAGGLSLWLIPALTMAGSVFSGWMAKRLG